MFGVVVPAAGGTESGDVGGGDQPPCCGASSSPFAHRSGSVWWVCGSPAAGNNQSTDKSWPKWLFLGCLPRGDCSNIIIPCAL